MAEPDYSAAATWPHLTTGPASQGAELAAPLLSAHAPFQQQLPPLYGSPYMAMNNHSISRNNDALDAPVSNQPQGRTPYPPPGPRYPYYNHPHLFSYQFHGPPRPPPAFWSAPEQMHGDPSFFDHGNMMQGYSPMLAPGTSPHHHQLAGSLSTGLSPHLQRRYGRRLTVDALARSSHAGGVRAPHQGSQEPSPEARLPSVRSQPQDHQQANEPSRSSSRPRPWMSPDEQGRRSDRSISPRTSNRRSYDRYSFDILPHSSTSSDAEEAAARAPPLSRMRHRPRDVRPRFTSHRPHIDPNIATCQQIQELKDGLPRRLPSELPEDASKACDICQKDYSTSHVTPKEEEEIAIVLSCGHIFGEFCISEWFDTCRTHKNKVTCPMCRKQLIEAPRYVQTVMHAFPRNGQAFVDLLAHGIPRDLEGL